MLRLNLVHSLDEYIFRPIKKSFFFFFEIRERKYNNEPKKGYSAGAWQPGKKKYRDEAEKPIQKRANGEIQEKTQSLTLCCIEMLILSQQSHFIL